MNSKRNELLAGVFVLLALATLVGVVVWLGAGQVLQRPAGAAYFYVNEASGATGLSVGNPVMINDRQVGRIVAIEPTASGRTLYQADLFMSDLGLHSDGTAVAIQPMVGTPKLVITHRGSDAKPAASSDSPMPLQPSGLDAAMGDIAAAAEDLRQVAQTVREEMDPQKRTAMLGQIKTVMGSLSQAADNISGVSGRLLHETDPKAADSLLAKAHASVDDVNRITSSVSTQLDSGNPLALLAKIHRSADDVNAITADAKPKVRDTLSALQGTAQQLETYTRKDVAAILADLRQINSRVMTISGNFVEVSDQTRQIVALSRDRLDEMLDNMTQVSQDLKATAKEVRRNPWRLLYQPDQKELRSQNIHDAARAFAAGAEQLDQALGKLSTLSKSSSGGLKGDDPDLLKIRQQLQETFESFTKAEQALWKELAK